MQCLQHWFNLSDAGPPRKSWRPARTSAPVGLQSPWTVNRIEIDMAEQRFRCSSDRRPGAAFVARALGARLAGFDYAEDRRRRRLYSCQFLSYLHA